MERASLASSSKLHVAEATVKEHANADEPTVDPSALEKPSLVEMSHDLNNVRSGVAELKVKQAVQEILRLARASPAAKPYAL